MLKKSQVLKEGKRQGLNDALRIITRMLNESTNGGEKKMNDEFCRICMTATSVAPVMDMVESGADVNYNNGFETPL